MGLGRLWNGKVVLHSGNNRKRRGTGTRHSSARGQQQLLEGLQTWDPACCCSCWRLVMSTICTDKKGRTLVSDSFLGLATCSSTGQRFFCEQAVVEHYINDDVTSVAGYALHVCPNGCFSQWTDQVRCARSAHWIRRSILPWPRMPAICNSSLTLDANFDNMKLVSQLDLKLQSCNFWHNVAWSCSHIQSAIGTLAICGQRP